jgi:hypothetical protein
MYGGLRAHPLNKRVQIFGWNLCATFFMRQQTLNLSVMLHQYRLCERLQQQTRYRNILITTVALYGRLISRLYYRK